MPSSDIDRMRQPWPENHALGNFVPAHTLRVKLHHSVASSIHTTTFAAMAKKSSMAVGEAVFAVALFHPAPALIFASQQSRKPNVRSGSITDIRNVRPMSALPPKADIGTQQRNVRCVPKADIRIDFC